MQSQKADETVRIRYGRKKSCSDDELESETRNNNNNKKRDSNSNETQSSTPPRSRGHSSAAEVAMNLLAQRCVDKLRRFV